MKSKIKQNSPLNPPHLRGKVRNEQGGVSKAFTLVEIIVWITISIILMTSISVFVSSWLSNINIQQKLLEDNYNSSFFFDDLENLPNSTSNWLPIFSNTSSWVLLKLNKNLWKWWFVFVWKKEFDKLFCKDSENTKTNHIFIKKFIPFEWIWADIFSWSNSSNYNFWWIKTNYFSWTKVGIIWEYSSPNDVVLWNWTDIYVSDTLNHNILKNWVIVAWKSSFLDNSPSFVDWNLATWTYFNNPTWLAFWENKLFISDTLNNRILYLSWTQLYKLLDNIDWLYEPTWLFYSDSRKSLFISNSWKWEVLEYSSSWTNIPNLNISFSPKENFLADKFNLEFLTWASSSSIVLLNNLTLTWNYTFSGFIQSSDSWVISGNKATYSFLNSSWSWIPQNFSSWTIYWIEIKNIAWNNLDLTWSYFVKLSMFSWSVLKYYDYFPYYSNWDNFITTTKENSLKIITWWLSYPTWISFSWTDLLVNDFIDRKQKKLNISWNLVDSSDLSNFNFSIFDYDKNFDNILSLPVKSFDYNYTSSLLTMILKYYKSYNCYNLDEKVDRTYIFKKSF